MDVRHKTSKLPIFLTEHEAGFVRIVLKEYAIAMMANPGESGAVGAMIIADAIALRDRFEALGRKLEALP